jgi:hypothetical protein
MIIGSRNRINMGNLPQYHIVHHKHHINLPGIELGPPPSERSHSSATETREINECLIVKEVEGIGFIII